MKAATVKQLKDELAHKEKKELIEICLNLAKFKKDSKELLTYLLFEADDERSYIQGIKEEMKEEFSLINVSSFYFMKKSVRKILRTLKKQIRYSKKTETEVELLLYFCYLMRQLNPSIEHHTALHNIFLRQLAMAKKKINMLHEDLQYDYQLELEEIE